MGHVKNHLNYYFLGLAVLLLSFGTLFLAALSMPDSLQVFGNTNHFLFHQLIAIAIGLIGAFIVFKTPMHVLKKMALPLLILNLLAMAVILVPMFGSTFWGAKRWVSVGNINFQPSEFLKLTSIIYLAALLSNRFSTSNKKGWLFSVKKRYDVFMRVFLPFILLAGIITIALILQKDISTLGIITITLLVVYFSAGTPLWHAGVCIAAGLGGLLVLIKIEPYRVQRLLVFLHPETDPTGIGLQIKQSLLALGSGGIFGKGIGMSTQKFGFLPQAMSDSIFAILGEETGIIGCATLVILLLVFLWLGFKIANSSHDTFSKLTAIGITVWIVTQACVNIASTLGIFPLSGIPLPFFSYGGSHIIAEMMGVGIILNVSKNS
jgi:cell division protein FtsW